jgi:CHASE3 domain sensor protein
LALIVLAVNAWVSYHNTRQLVENEEWVSHVRQVLSALDGVLLAMTDAETGQRGYLLSGDPATLSQEIRVARERCDSDLGLATTIIGSTPWNDSAPKKGW